MTSFSLETYKIAVLPIADRCKHTKNEFCNDENNPNGFLRNVGGWFKKISHNRCHLDFTLLPVLVVQQNLNSFSTAGGMGPPPGNSQMLVEKVLSLADDSILRFLHITEGRLAIVAPGRFKPHTWHIPNGGKPILREGERSPRRKVVCHRYALIPEKTNLGMFAHELGHLLFGWPDLKWNHTYAKECLMAEGASNESGKSPAEPCGPLLYRQGWRDELKIESDTPVHSLHRDNVGITELDGKKILVEFRNRHNTDAKTGIEKPRLLVYQYDNMGYSKILLRKYLENHSADPKLLGLLAPFLRRC